MRTILVLNSKGGSGKTTIATNLAGYYASSGAAVALADFDPQGSSLDWLAALATSDARHVANHATMAIALHAVPQATDRLIAIARGNHTADVRGTAVFWLAQRAGDKAAGAISDALEDPDTEVKKKAVFALSQLPKNEGVPKLMEVARTNKNPEVRRQAIVAVGWQGDLRRRLYRGCIARYSGGV